MIATGLRVLLGSMLVVSGWFWIGRHDPGAYLHDAISQALDNGMPVGLYAPFLRSVVLPNDAAFAFLVGWGELLAGLSVAGGCFGRVGAGVAAFQLVQYGLMGGYASLAIHAALAGIIVGAVLASSRLSGIDRWIRRRGRPDNGPGRG